MGFQAIVVLHLDAVPKFRDHPKEFGEAVLAALVTASDSCLPVASPMQDYASCITAHPPRHMGVPALYLLSGGSCIELSGKQLMDMHRKDPKHANTLLDHATTCIAEAKCVLETRTPLYVQKAKHP